MAIGGVIGVAVFSKIDTSIQNTTLEQIKNIYNEVKINANRGDAEADNAEPEGDGQAAVQN